MSDSPKKASPEADLIERTMGGLHEAFEQRSAFLERTLRTKHVAGRALDVVLGEETWQDTILGQFIFRQPVLGAMNDGKQHSIPG